MTFDIQQEDLITFRELVSNLPRKRRGRKVTLTTAHRWRTRGLSGGIRLSAIKVGGVWHTSWAAFNRFCEKLSIANDNPPDLPTATDSPANQDVEPSW